MQRATDVKSYTCIRCPLGCNLEVSFDEAGEVIEVSGYTCSKGKEYALEESTNPKRMVTSYVCAQGCLEPLSVKTAGPVPKEAVADVLAQIAALDVKAPIAAGDVLIEDVCGTGVAVIATKTLDCI